MKKTVLYILWGCLYALCVGLGTVEDPEGLGKVLFVLTSLIFFLPPAVLLYTAKKQGEKKTLLVLRVISILSLSMTLTLLVLNFLSVGASAKIGQRLYELLNLVSAPMLCSQYWVLSLFLWACLLWTSIGMRKK